MSAEENKAKVRRVFEEAWNKGNLAVVDETSDPKGVGHVVGSPDLRGTEAVKQFITVYRTAFPDLHITIEDQVAEGDKVVTRWSSTGTHKGDLMGIAPTGKKTHVTGISIDRFAGGKSVEDWTNWDQMSLLQQLGVVPAAAPAPAARR